MLTLTAPAQRFFSIQDTSNLLVAETMHTQNETSAPCLL